MTPKQQLQQHAKKNRARERAQLKKETKRKELERKVQLNELVLNGMTYAEATFVTKQEGPNRALQAVIFKFEQTEAISQAFSSWARGRNDET